jgi:thiol-disulfide isomerase/thioredoxin
MRSIRIFVVGLVGLLLFTVGRAERVRGDSNKPDDAIRKMSDFYKQLKSFSVRAKISLDFHAGEMSNKSSSDMDFVFERPNRLAMKGEGEGPVGVTVVSDGKTLYTSISALKRYTKKDAPKSLSGLAEDPIASGGAGMGNFLIYFVADDPAKLILKGVTASKDLGTTKLDGRPARHLQFTQDQMDWEAWIADGQEPVLLRLEIDLAKLVKKTGDDAFKGKEVKAKVVEDFKDWKLNFNPPASDFVFTPPKESKEVPNLFGRDEEEEEAPSPLLGKAAPPVDLERLDGKRVKLADHLGKDVVMLDMWATWCGPCRAELPLLLDVAKEYQSKGVALYGINQGETKKKVEEFLKKEKYDLTVGLDTEGKVGEAYKVEGIPLLAIIDKKGVVQSIHVGYSPDIKDVLHKELDAILAGKNLAAETLARYEASKKKQQASARGLEQAWSTAGPYSSAAYDPQSQSIFALKGGKECDVLSLDGKVLRSFAIKAHGNLLRLARPSRAAKPILLVFGVWSAPLVACSSTDGSKLWTEKSSDGIDDVWAADLDGDGRDEVIVGFNGSGGLRVLDADGVLRWKTTKIGNVWHVAAGDLHGDNKLEVITTSAEGKVHIFDADGKSPQTFSSPFYAFAVRAGRLAKQDAADTILVTSGEALAALDGQGKVLWNHPLSGDVNHVDAMALAPTRPWLALAGRGGGVLVTDCAKQGEVIAASKRGSRMLDVAWAVADDHETPLLLISDGQALSAFRVKPEAAPAKDQEKDKEKEKEKDKQRAAAAR